MWDLAPQTSSVDWELIQFFIGFFLIALFMVLLHVILLSVALRKSQQNQLAVLAALEAAAKTNAEILEAVREAGARIADAPAADAPDAADAEPETPADFVYCPECSTRVEVDPFIRNINVLCPDCKKPFHIH